MADRTAQVHRETKETRISITLNLDGSGTYQIDTGVKFFDHMLSHLAKHAKIDLQVEARGDLEVDAHHTVEDTGICLGQALAQAAGDKKGMTRFGYAACPMDEALVVAALDFCGRSHLEYNVVPPTAKVGDFDTELVAEFFAALVVNAGMVLHLNQQAGRNTHHILESTFKSFARALEEACRIDPRMSEVQSTKGTL